MAFRSADRGSRPHKASRTSYAAISRAVVDRLGVAGGSYGGASPRPQLAVRRGLRLPRSVLRAILPGGDSLQDHFEGAFTGRVITRDQRAVNDVPEDRREVARAFKHHEINLIAR